MHGKGGTCALPFIRRRRRACPVKWQTGRAWGRKQKLPEEGLARSAPVVSVPSCRTTQTHGCFPASGTGNGSERGRRSAPGGGQEEAGRASALFTSGVGSTQKLRRSLRSAGSSETHSPTGEGHPALQVSIASCQ